MGKKVLVYLPQEKFRTISLVLILVIGLVTLGAIFAEFTEQKWISGLRTRDVLWLAIDPRGNLPNRLE